MAILDEVKKGLQISSDNTELDGVISQKILAVQSYMLGAGVSEVMIADDLAVGVIVMGVGDMWNLKEGAVKFSELFNTLLSQLVYRS